MNKTFKEILWNIAKLTPKHQAWLLAQLSPQYKQQFKQWQGYSLLEQAQKFRKLPCPELPQVAVASVLPVAAKKLNQHGALYVAIILEQGQFSWESLFLATNRRAQEIEQLTNSILPQIKATTKNEVFKLWQTQLGFADQLESSNG